MMFISKDYVSKKWPGHEAQSAIARQIDQFGDYILPVKFDETEVPGLSSMVNYLDGAKLTPQEVASVFLNKFSFEAGA